MIIFIDLPQVDGNLKALISGNDVTFTWDTVLGTFTGVEIYQCTPDCIKIYGTTDTSASSAIVSGIHFDDAKYKLMIFQGDQLVTEYNFEMKGKRNSSMSL